MVELEARRSGLGTWTLQNLHTFLGLLIMMSLYKALKG